jgi:predicted lipase
VASNADFIMLVFRGTETRRREGRTDFRDIFADLRVDSDLRLVESGQRSRVHQGFKRALDEVWEELFRYIKSIHQSNRKLWITGHSLGAALAVLAADRYGDVQGLYTFGSPGIGDAGFRNDFRVSAYRIVNGNDIVTRILPSGLYYHVGKLEYIDSNGILHDNPGHWARWMDAARGGTKNLFKSLGQVRHGFAALVPPAVRDHVPTLYATHIWNNIP